MKNDFGGHDNFHFNNMYAYVGQGLDVCQQLNGHSDYFYNNSVVMYQDGVCATDTKWLSIVSNLTLLLQAVRELQLRPAWDDCTVRQHRLLPHRYELLSI